MAKKTTGLTDESTSGYFRRIFEKNPSLLKSKTNDQVLDHWRQDHGGAEPENRIKQILSNVKSTLRHKGRRKAAQEERRAVSGPAVPRKKPSTVNLEGLEVAIDDCLTTARGMDPEGLALVIDHLRRARNGVVWLSGQ